MNFLALASDYDGTVAKDGVVPESTLNALKQLQQSGRKLVLVTGRELDQLLQVFPQHEIFDWIVAENGALLYCPRTRESRLLTEEVPKAFPEELLRRGVPGVSVGGAIVATWRPHECQVLDVVRELGLDRQIIFNKDAVMVLPTGVNKASGLAAALKEMKISHHNVVAVGDAENDLPMLIECECGVAVDNALEGVKKKADFVTREDHGAGVEELIRELLEDDLRSRMSGLHSNGILLGRTKNDPNHCVYVPSLGSSVLVAGPSGSGKSTAVAGLLERMAKANYQFCLFDPEGDYEGFECAVNLGNPHYVPSAGEVRALLERMHSAVVNLLGVSLDSRPAYVSELLHKCDELRAEKGRPHWLVIDEAHHIFPSDWPKESLALVDPPKGSLMISVHPQHVKREALASADVVIAVGKDPDETIRAFCRTTGIAEPRLEPVELKRWEVLAWFRNGDADPFVVTIEPGKIELKRHIRKYADGDMREASFIFRGAGGKLNLSANNFSTFIRMAEGIDDETWLYHLRRHDYSRWVREEVKDEPLANEVGKIETSDGSAQKTRDAIFDAIRAHYTASE
jgi:hypothetical protein